MIDLQKVLGEDSKYVDEDSAATLESLSETSWPTILAALDIINGGSVMPGIDCTVAKTHETIDDFDSSRQKFWSEIGRRTEHVVNGCRAVLFERFQLRRGAQRQTQIVIDLGEIRVCLS